jgi:hypothetical protein
MKRIDDDQLLRMGWVWDRDQPERPRLTLPEITAQLAALRRWWRWQLSIGEYAPTNDSKAPPRIEGPAIPEPPTPWRDGT